MQRVAVVGCGGAGKSTFARELGRRSTLPVIHLDEHYWKPGWAETPRDDWVELQEALVAGDRWIIDGNYGSTFDVRFERADTVIVFAPPRTSCLRGAVVRTLRNWHRSIHAPACPERINLAFYRWIWNYERDSRPRLDAALARHPHLDVLELASRSAAATLLDGVLSAEVRGAHGC